MFQKFLFLTILFFTFTSQFAAAQTKSEILGVRVGMHKDAAHKLLQKIGKLEKEERKQQEVWALAKNPHYAYLIVAFNKEYTEVRFVTAKARDNGHRVRYSDVIDVKKARQEGATNNYKYVQEIPASDKNPAYTAVARGRDANYLTYFSLEKKD